MADKCCEAVAPAPFADAVVVLGCRRSAALKRRLDLGVRKFQEGAAPLLVLSGGGSGPVPEAEIMRRVALARGVPAMALLIEGSSRNTLENARETALLLSARGPRSVLLVSDRAHLMRAAFFFRLAGLEVVGRAGVAPPSFKLQAGAIIRESAAVLWNLLRALPHVRWSRLLGGQPRQQAPKQDGNDQGRAAGQQE